MDRSIQILKKIKPEKFAFKYASENNDFVDYLYYSDKYFLLDSRIINTSLLTQSLSFVMSGFSSKVEEYDKKYKNSLDILQKVGFNKISANNDYKSKPRSNSLGVIFAYKKIKKYKLICAIIRSANYDKEWISNFTIGDNSKNNYHQGFYEGSEIYLNSLKEYIKENNIKGNIKLWSIGFSRGGAVNNISIGRLILNLENDKYYLGKKVKLQKKDIFAHCFETPQGVLFNDLIDIKDVKFNSILNIINFNDLVPKVVPTSLNYSRFGRDLFLPDVINDFNYNLYLPKIIDKYNEFLSVKDRPFSISSFNMIPEKLEKLPLINKIKYYNYPQGLYMIDLLNLVMKKAIVSLENYTILFQEKIRNALFNYYSSNIENKNIISAFKDNLKIKLLKKSLGKIGKTLLNYRFLFIPLLSEKNIDALKCGHYPEVCLAFLRAMDKNYSLDPIKWDFNADYYIIELKDNECEISISIGDKIILQKDKKKNIILNKDITCIINDNILIYLPTKNKYRIYTSSNCLIKKYSVLLGKNINIKNEPIISNNYKLYLLE